MKRFGLVIILITSLFAFIGALFSQPVTAQEKLSPDLLTLLAETQTPQRVILYLTDQTTFARQQLSSDPTARRAEMIAQLQATAVRQQTPLLAQLQQYEDVSEVRPLWLTNAIALTASPHRIKTLANHPTIQKITIDHISEIPPLTLESFSNPLPIQVRSWGIHQIRAPHAWHGLGLDGSGVTVAIMDTGVDWTHPDLIGNYRGNLGNGQFDHSASWYSPVSPNSTQPFDLIGHGTHVAGTAVSQNGYGIAPNAQWIAVNITEPNGAIFDSAVIAGFQWLMAPNNNPALAPDLINHSWGGVGSRTTLQEIVETVEMAGIFNVFAAGNSGPTQGSIASPASFPNALAVGASDQLNQVAWFSSRGPSPVTGQNKPHLVAPGTSIPSTFPSNQFAYATGTSMSTPHVTGALALLLQANGNLNHTQLFELLAQTSHPLSTTLPNSDSGWGLLDSYALGASQQPHSTISGLVQANGIPLANAVVTITTPSGAQLPFITEANGRFTAWLQTGSYTVQTAPFGYTPYNQTVSLQTGQTESITINLTPFATGRIQGQILSNGQPIPATIEIVGTPIMQPTQGSYSIDLPAGNYTLKASAVGQRTTTSSFTLSAGQTINRNILLASAPSVLLVDGDAWGYAPTPALPYYQNALDEMRYGYDQWRVFSPVNAAPSLDTLQQYDTVIWAAPNYAPGLIGAGETISNYLGIGGNLLIAGQDVAATDGFAFGTRHWWYNQLNGRFIGQTTPNQTIQGVDGTPFAQFSLTLNGAGTARNQTTPDLALPKAGSLTEPIFTSTEEGQPLGLQAGHCQPFQLVYWGFGLEGVTGAQTRADLVTSAFDYFATPKQTEGVRWRNEAIDQVVLQANQVVYTLTVQNLSETLTDTFTIQTQGAEWVTAVTTPTLTLGPCQSGQTVLTIHVPPQLERDVVDEMVLTAVSGNNPAIQDQLNIRHKTPAPILMVDDHRWYDQHTRFTNRLDTLGLGYDVWVTDDNVEGQGSPSPERLQAYDMLIWSTGSDWYAPITPAEQTAIISYLENGGRLFLSSQDFLYYHHDEPLAQDYFDIIAYQESITPTIGYANNEPHTLQFSPYRNYADAMLTHTPTQFWHNRGIGGLATNGTQNQQDWRAVFWSYPIESLPQPAMDKTLASILGWLTNIGGSTLEVGAHSVTQGEVIPYTVTVRHAGEVNSPTAVTITLPTSLTLVTQTLPTEWVYNQPTNQLHWADSLTGEVDQTLTFSARPVSNLPNGTRLETQAQFSEEVYGVTWEQTAVVYYNAPDLTNSTINSFLGDETATYQLILQNDGLTASQPISLSWYLPYNTHILTNTLHATNGTAQFNHQHHLIWQGDVPTTTPIILTVQLSITNKPYTQWFISTADIRVNHTQPILLTNQNRLDPYYTFFPFVIRP